MLQKTNEPKRLLEYLQENELLSKRAVYTDLRDWKFSKIVIRSFTHYITLGVYQLKQAASYTKEHLTYCWLYGLFVHKEQSNIWKVKIQSRHVRNTIQTVVGCCSHIASVIWYLGMNVINPSPTTKVSVSRKTVLQLDIIMVDSDVEYL